MSSTARTFEADRFAPGTIRIPPAALPVNALATRTVKNVRTLTKTGTVFMLTGLDVAFTMLDCADISQDPEARRRALEIARRAYDHVQLLMPRLVLDLEHAQTLEGNLRTLAAGLRVFEESDG